MTKALHLVKIKMPCAQTCAVQLLKEAGSTLSHFCDSLKDLCLRKSQSRRENCPDDNPFIMLHHLLLVSFRKSKQETKPVMSLRNPRRQQNMLCFDNQEAAHYIVLISFSCPRNNWTKVCFMHRLTALIFNADLKPLHIFSPLHCLPTLCWYALIARYPIPCWFCVYF